MEPSVSALESEIIAVRSQVDALRHRKSLLLASLLASRKTRRVARNCRDARLSTAELQSAAATIDERLSAVTASNHRATSGLTAFRIEDPDPNAPTGRKLVGIRLEVYSTRERKFLSPYYLIFRQLEDRVLRLHKHTIPACIPLRIFLRKYMPVRAGEERHALNEREQAQNLTKLVRAVRNALVALVNRKDCVEKLKTYGGEGMTQVKEVQAVDPSVMDVELLLQDQSVVKLHISLSGRIEKAIVRTEHDGDSRLRRRLEGLMVDPGARLDSILSILETGH